MKQIKNLVIAVVLILGLSTGANAQVKIGHINSEQLVRLMPESAKIEKELQSLGKTFDDEFKSMYAEFESKGRKYDTEASSKTESINQSRMKEMQDMQQRIQQYQQNAQKELQKKRFDLLQPILEKAQKAIDAVAKDKGLDYILDSSKGQLLFAKESKDILNDAKKKLGIK
ncbi:MAG: OmpH family outer membrane protein [Ichthyobacteriaceae bacterium]|nr:OmpH family outer membrane protein [Ichthyobacteriaceae bacterium]